MEAAEVITQLWARIQARDWAGLSELLDEDATLEYPVTGEVFRGRSSIVGINAEYAEGWSIHVLRLVADGDEVVTEVEVPMEGSATFRVASFWTVRSGRVVRAREYWVSLGVEEAPTWREPFRAPS